MDVAFFGLWYYVYLMPLRTKGGVRFSYNTMQPAKQADPSGTIFFQGRNL